MALLYHFNRFLGAFYTADTASFAIHIIDFRKGVLLEYNDPIRTVQIADAALVALLQSDLGLERPPVAGLPDTALGWLGYGDMGKVTPGVITGDIIV
jgi:hypothetical protein